MQKTARKEAVLDAAETGNLWTHSFSVHLWTNVSKGTISIYYDKKGMKSDFNLSLEDIKSKNENALELLSVI
jgi:hypothetical protein